MNPTLETLADGALPPEPELDACIAQIQPVILTLMRQGIQASAIIAALARLAVVTVAGERQH